MVTTRKTESEFFMRQALALAARGRGRTSPNPPVGAILVKRGTIVGKGWHRKAGGDHAEIAAIKDAGARARGATLYVTLEPCSTTGKTGPCTEAVVAAGIAKAAVASVDPNPKHRGAGLRVLKRAGVSVESGVMQQEGDSLIAPFSKWITSGLPYVTLKMAMSLDGRTTDKNGKSQWISCSESRERVRRFRGTVDAVMVGARTVLDDDPSLYPIAARDYQPLRVTVSTAGRLPLNRKLFRDDVRDRTVVFVGSSCTQGRRQAFERSGAKVVRTRKAGGRVSLKAALRRLAGMGVLHVFCEGGAVLAGGLLKGGLVDSLDVYSAPFVLGDEGASVLSGASWALGQAPEMRMVASSRVGCDLLTQYSIGVK